MHIRQIRLGNTRGFESLDWERDGDLAGWHVILGNNGSGKSTLLKAIALALVGPKEAAALRQDWALWIRAGKASAGIAVVLQRHEPHDGITKGGRHPLKFYPHVGVQIERDDTSVHIKKASGHKLDPSRTVWGGYGWFSASYGPFRRFEGGDKEYEKLFYSRPRLARHLSVFGEAVALSECIGWLKNLRFMQLAGDPEGALLDPVTEFVNQTGLLPRGVQLSAVTPKGVVFRDQSGCELPVETLSDGYRSVLSLTFELLRQLAATYGAAALFNEGCSEVVVPGVVLIDEVDAHLHPTWQRRIGLWFRQHFPQIQFIVATHSPLVCHAADRGSVFLLAQPGTDEQSRFLQGPELSRVIYGDVLDAYGSGAFGDGVTRSDAGHAKLQRLAELNRKDLDEGLDDADKKEQQQLRAMFPTSTAALPADTEPVSP